MRMSTAAALLVVVQVHPASAEEWSRFRGPGGSGVLESVNLPVEFGTDRNVRWKVALIHRRFDVRLVSLMRADGLGGPSGVA
jgi:hypothetical protein